MMETTKARILIADDESSIRFVLREALESQGYTVTESADGTHALEALEAENFDLAFLDIRMPGMTGIEILERLQTSPLDTSIVIITAQSTFESAVEAMKLGALDYLSKPFALGEALAARGWHHDRQGPPESLHLTVSAGNAAALDEYLSDLTSAAEESRGGPSGRATNYATLE